MIDAVEIELNDTFAEPYWQAINDTTRDKIDDVLRVGTTEGASIRTMAAEIEKLGGQYSTQPRHEHSPHRSSGAMNSGHELAMRQLEQELGLPVGKEWYSVLGDTTRESHAELDGRVVPVKDSFVLAGVPVPYPAHRSLPPSERCNCQCGITSAVGGR